jgi:hypothetical protein
MSANANANTIAARVSSRRAAVAKREIESLSIEELDDLIGNLYQQINKYTTVLPSLYRIQDDKIDDTKRNLNAIYANILKMEHSPMASRAQGSVGLLSHREKLVKQGQIRKMKETMEELSKAAAAAKKERERERRATRRAATAVATVAAATGGGSAAAAPAPSENENVNDNLDPLLAEMLGGLQFGGSRKRRTHKRTKTHKRRSHH